MIDLVNLKGEPVVMFAEHTRGPSVPEAAVRVIAVDPLKPAARLRETPLAPVRLFGSAADPVPVRDVQYGPAVLDLPPPAVGVAYIVPLPVALAARRRHDLLVTSDPVRDATGTVIGCRALARPL